MIERGDCFYDITKIKDITNGSAGQALIKAAGSVYNVSTDSIDQNSKKINTFDENNLDERKSKKRSYNPVEDADVDDEGNIWVEDEEDGEKYLLKLCVEEALSNNEKEVFTRAYQLKDIIKVANIPNSVHFQQEGLTDDTFATVYSIADLFEIVKEYDKNFNTNQL